MRASREMGASLRSKESYVCASPLKRERTIVLRVVAPLKRRCAAAATESGCRSKNSHALTPMALPVEKSLSAPQHRIHRSTQRTRQRTHKKHDRQNGIAFLDYLQNRSTDSLQTWYSVSWQPRGGSGRVWWRSYRGFWQTVHFEVRCPRVELESTTT